MDKPTSNGRSKASLDETKMGQCTVLWYMPVTLEVFELKGCGVKRGRPAYENSTGLSSTSKGIEGGSDRAQAASC